MAIGWSAVSPVPKRIPPGSRNIQSAGISIRNIWGFHRDLDIDGFARQDIMRERRLCRGIQLFAAGEDKRVGSRPGTGASILNSPGFTKI